MKLTTNEQMLDGALHEAGKILITAFELLNASGKLSATVESNGTHYTLTFEKGKQEPREGKGAEELWYKYAKGETAQSMTKEDFLQAMHEHVSNQAKEIEFEEVVKEYRAWLSLKDTFSPGHRQFPIPEEHAQWFYNNLIVGAKNVSSKDTSPDYITLINELQEENEPITPPSPSLSEELRAKIEPEANRRYPEWYQRQFKGIFTNGAKFACDELESLLSNSSQK